MIDHILLQMPPVKEELSVDFIAAQLNEEVQKFKDEYWENDITVTIPFPAKVYCSTDFAKYYGECGSKLSIARVVGQPVMWETSVFSNLNELCIQKIMSLKRELRVTPAHEKAYDLLRAGFRRQYATMVFMPIEYLMLISKELGILCMPDSTMIGSRDFQDKFLRARPRPLSAVGIPFMELMNMYYWVVFLRYVKSRST